MKETTLYISYKDVRIGTGSGDIVIYRDEILYVDNIDSITEVIVKGKEKSVRFFYRPDMGRSHSRADRVYRHENPSVAINLWLRIVYKDD